MYIFLLFLLFYNDVNFKYFLAFVIIFFTFHIILTLGLTLITDGRSCWLVERTSKKKNLSRWYCFSIEKKEFFRILILLFFHWSHNNIFILINFEQQEYKKAFLKKIIIAIELLRFLTLPSSPHSLIISLTNYRNCTSQWEMTEYRQKNHYERTTTH